MVLLLRIVFDERFCVVLRFINSVLFHCFVEYAVRTWFFYLFPPAMPRPTYPTCPICPHPTPPLPPPFPTLPCHTFCTLPSLCSSPPHTPAHLCPFTTLFPFYHLHAYHFLTMPCAPYYYYYLITLPPSSSSLVLVFVWTGTRQDKTTCPLHTWWDIFVGTDGWDRTGVWVWDRLDCCWVVGLDYLPRLPRAPSSLPRTPFQRPSLFALCAQTVGGFRYLLVGWFGFGWVGWTGVVGVALYACAGRVSPYMPGLLPDMPTCHPVTGAAARTHTPACSTHALFTHPRLT